MSSVAFPAADGARASERATKMLPCPLQIVDRSPGWRGRDRISLQVEAAGGPGRMELIYGGATLAAAEVGPGWGGKWSWRHEGGAIDSEAFVLLSTAPFRATLLLQLRPRSEAATAIQRLYLPPASDPPVARYSDLVRLADATCRRPAP